NVPKAIVEEAERSGLPLFEVPFTTRHRDIIAFVNESLLSHDMYLLRRAFSMQRYLIDAVASDSPEEELVSRLGSMLQSSVLLLRDNGTVLASEGRAPAGRIWQELSAREDDRHRLIVAGWAVRASPVATPGGRPNWLVIATRRPTIEEHLARPVIEAAERLLSVLRFGQQAAAAEERSLRSELLAQLLDDDAGKLRPSRDPVLRARLTSAGLTGQGDVRMIVVEALDDEADALESVRRMFDGELQRTARPYLLGVRQRRVVALVEREVGREQEVEAWVGALSRDGVSVNVGVGRRIDSVERADISFRDALLALHECRRRGIHGAVMTFEELDLATLALAQAGVRELVPKVDAVIAPLRDRPPLEETLRAYFEANLDVIAAAQALHLHHNSVRYRLSQVEKLLSVDLRSPATIANLHLALLAAAALAESSDDANGRADSGDG
ncbi:MAG TPA: helix-turn-helix domain-containing protein, partial [Solirubrobacteraceae bacterium]|nr:helix-turn-helix domain-containing protein [Solirubrobacteraceae bacterium]